MGAAFSRRRRENRVVSSSDLGDMPSLSKEELAGIRRRYCPDMSVQVHERWCEAQREVRKRTVDVRGLSDVSTAHVEAVRCNNNGNDAVIYLEAKRQVARI